MSKHSIKFSTVLSGPGERLETVPDVVFRDAEGITVAITDSKYKVLGTRPESSDTYQVLTAGHVLGCSRVSLTYPVAKDRAPTVWQVSSELGGRYIVLTALPLNLMSLTRTDGQEALVETIGKWLSSPLASLSDEEGAVTRSSEPS